MKVDPALLVVDDEAIHRRFVETVLTPRGWKVDAAADGDDAIAMVRGRDYALVLMDIQMPRLDGYAAAAAIRATGGPHAAVPILAFTALGGADFTARMRAAGMDGHVPKPCTPEALDQAAGRWRPPSAPHPGPRLAAVFGEAEIADLLARFRVRLAAALAASDDPEQARKGAHGIAGIAGTLGFADVHERWLAVSEGDETAIEGARIASRKALLMLDRGPESSVSD